MAGERFQDLVALMARLRAPGGCPWDREQTFDTIKPFLLEETYEVVDAIDRRDFQELKGELGDLLLQVVFFAQMAADEGRFTIDDVVERIHTKMVRRHPHVFGDGKPEHTLQSAGDGKPEHSLQSAGDGKPDHSLRAADGDPADLASANGPATGDEVLRRWEDLKAEEQRQHAEAQGGQFRPAASVLDGVARAIPALLEAYQLSSRASFVGFDWPNIEGVLEKIEEELQEIRQALREADAEQRRRRCQDELGDLLFVAVNAVRFLGLEPESAMRRANQKFRRRFGWLEARLAERGKKPAECTLEELEALWQRSKQESAE